MSEVLYSVVLYMALLSSQLTNYVFGCIRASLAAVFFVCLSVYLSLCVCVCLSECWYVREETGPEIERGRIKQEREREREREMSVVVSVGELEGVV